MSKQFWNWINFQFFFLCQCVGNSTVKYVDFVCFRVYNNAIGGGQMRVNIYLGKDFLTDLKLQAKRYEMSVSQYIRYAIKKLWESEAK